MGFEHLPASAAWRHLGAREGFESVFLTEEPFGYRFDGCTAAVEDGQAWAVRYTVAVDERWVTRAARVVSWSVAGEHDVRLDADGSGHWEVDGSPCAELDGCLDVDLESSACTNALPVHRLVLGVGQSARAPAAYVRSLGVGVERLEQEYTRLDDGDGHQRYEYRAPGFDFECQLVYDGSGLVLEYPGIATRVL
jgi:hypothetical protein